MIDSRQVIMSNNLFWRTLLTFLRLWHLAN